MSFLWWCLGVVTWVTCSLWVRAMPQEGHVDYSVEGISSETFRHLGLTEIHCRTDEECLLYDPKLRCNGTCLCVSSSLYWDEDSEECTEFTSEARVANLTQPKVSPVLLVPEDEDNPEPVPKFVVALFTVAVLAVCLGGVLYLLKRYRQWADNRRWSRKKKHQQSFVPFDGPRLYFEDMEEGMLLSYDIKYSKTISGCPENQIKGFPAPLRQSIKRKRQENCNGHVPTEHGAKNGVNGACKGSITNGNVPKQTQNKGCPEVKSAANAGNDRAVVSVVVPESYKTDKAQGGMTDKKEHIYEDVDLNDCETSVGRSGNDSPNLHVESGLSAPRPRTPETAL